MIAKRLTQSKSEVPHFYTTAEVPLDDGLALRKSLANDHGVKVSVNDLVIKASALALRDFPAVNLSPTVDISVAVATPSGLITPIVPQTDTLGLSQISSKVRDLATRARDGKLQPEEVREWAQSVGGHIISSTNTNPLRGSFARYSTREVPSP